MTNTFFQLRNFVHAASYRDQTIILDMVSNHYFSLNQKDGMYFSYILMNEFKCENALYIPIILEDINSTNICEKIDIEKLNKYIKLYNKKCFIEETNAEDRKNYIASAKIPVGMSKMEWVSFIKKSSLKIKWLELIKMFFILIKTHRILKNKAMPGLLSLFENQYRKSYKRSHSLSIEKINRFAFILDKACMIYPRRTLCLPWAGALTLFLLKYGKSFDFVIGVQTSPFYAHAWVEVNGQVINDNPEVKDRLAPIFIRKFQ